MKLTSPTETVAHADTTVDVQIACDDPDVPGRTEIADWIEAAVAAARSAAGGPVEVSVRVVDAQEIQALNASYRQQDKPTNVLSFPADAAVQAAEEPVLLGDVVVCAPVVRSEALEQGKALAHHWAHMLIHGTLHLLGYDHEVETDAARMEGLETAILEAHGIANPYASP